MRFPINARTVMLLTPILLLTALEYLLKIPSVSGNHVLGSLIRAIIPVFSTSYLNKANRHKA